MPDTYTTTLFKNIPATANMYVASALYTKGDLYTQTEIQTISGNLADAISQAASKVYRVCGSVSTLADLYGIVDKTVGDVYNVEESGDNYVYVGSATGAHITNGWDNLGGIIDLSPYTKWEDISATHNKVLNSSASWDSAYNALTSTSGNWNSAYNALTSTSANWNNGVPYTVFDIASGITGKYIDPTSGYTIADIVTSLNGLVSTLSAIYTSANDRN